LQRMDFRAQAGKGLHWRLDDVDMGPGDRDFAWAPAAGAHRLALVDGGGRRVAEVRFEVRGATAGAGPVQPASTLSSSSGGSLPTSTSAAGGAEPAGEYSGESER